MIVYDKLTGGGRNALIASQRFAAHPVGRIRGVGPVAGRHRDLRRAVLSGRTAYARDRSADGAGARRLTSCAWCCKNGARMTPARDWNRRRPWIDPIDGQHAVRR